MHCDLFFIIVVLLYGCDSDDERILARFSIIDILLYGCDSDEECTVACFSSLRCTVVWV